MYLERDIATEASLARARDAAVCAACPVRHIALCAGLGETALAELHDSTRRRFLRKGQTLAWEGEESPFIASVLSGLLQLSTSGADGREQIIGLVAAGGFVGRPHGGEMTHSVTAIAETELCSIAIDRFERFAVGHPGVRALLLERAYDELTQARRWLRLLGRSSASERVATLLLEFSSGRSGPCDFPMSRGKMADYAALTIETVSRQLSRFKADGIIALPVRDQFEIRDRAALLAIASDPRRKRLH